MAQKVIIPRMGQTMTEGTVARFLVRDGDRVQADTDIYELEYDKSTANIPAKKAGTVRLLVEEGTVVPLGQPVAVILEDGESLDSIDLTASKDVAVAAPRADAVTAAVPFSIPAAESPAQELKYSAAPKIKKMAREMGIDLSAVIPADGKRITAEDLEAFANQSAKQSSESAEAPAKVKISSLARKLAQELGVDVNNIVPADGQRITRDDVKAYAAGQKSAADFHGGPDCGTKCRRCNWTASEEPAGDRRVKMSAMRKVISQRMSESATLYPAATLTTEVDMTELNKMRTQLNSQLAAKGVKLSVTDLLVKAAAKALRDNEIVNTSLEGDEIVYHSHVNIGIAVAVPNGLLVPVVRDVDKLSLEQISAESKRLIAKAEDGTLGGDDMSGGTFSLTNLGMVGIDGFTPIINMPQSAILGIGRTVDKPAVVNGQITIRAKAVLSITHDHRVIDGYPAALFLQSMTYYIENPCLLLLD